MSRAKERVFGRCIKFGHDHPITCFALFVSAALGAATVVGIAAALLVVPRTKKVGFLRKWNLTFTSPNQQTALRRCTKLSQMGYEWDAIQLYLLPVYLQV